MNGTILRETLEEILPESKIERFSSQFGVIERKRKLEIGTLVRSLVLSAGSDDSGTLADAMRRYRSETQNKVVRGAFYHWMDEEMAMLMEAMLQEAMEYASSMPTYLPGILGTVDDWIAYDSETITLRDELAEEYPGTGSPAAVKVHKELSLGRGCVTYCHFGPAREHDGPNLELDERYRGKGLLVDLGYVSLKFIHDCKEYEAKYVIGLKDNWKPRVTRITRGEVQGEFFSGSDLDVLLCEEVIVLGGRCVDADVVIGRGKKAVCARMVMIPGPDGYLIYPNVA